MDLVTSQGLCLRFPWGQQHSSLRRCPNTKHNIAPSHSQLGRTVKKQPICSFSLSPMTYSLPHTPPADPLTNSNTNIETPQRDW